MQNTRDDSLKRSFEDLANCGLSFAVAYTRFFMEWMAVVGRCSYGPFLLPNEAEKRIKEITLNWSGSRQVLEVDFNAKKV